MASSADSSKKFPSNFSSKKGVLDVYSSMGDDFMSMLSGKSGLEQYRKMSWNDPIIGGLLLRMTSLYSSTSWFYNGDEIVPLPIIRRLVNEMTSIFTYGFYVGEILYDVKDGIKVIDVEPRGQLTIDDIDKKGIRQEGSDKIIPIDKCLYLYIMTDVRYKFGKSLLRHVYKPYFYKKSIEAAEAVGADRDLAGLPIMTAPEGFDFTAAVPSSPNYSELVKSTLDWATEIVSNIRRDEQEGVVLPNGWELELLKGQNNSLDTDKIIKRYNTEMCVGLLESFVSEGAFSSSTRDSNSSSVGMFLNSCEGWANFFEDGINKQVIERVCSYNGIKNIPKLKHAPINADDIKDLASYVARLVSQGVINPNPGLENELLRIAKLPEKEVKKNA